MGTNLTGTSESAWLRLKQHFTESFSGELLVQRGREEGEQVDVMRDQRMRNAYRYVLLLLAVIVLPIMAHNLYEEQLVPALGTLSLLGILVANILLLSVGRDAFLAPPVLLLLSMALIVLSLYYDQNYTLFLLFPLLVALPVLLRTLWAVVLGFLCGLVAGPFVFANFEFSTAVAIGISMGLTWLVSAWLVFAVTEQSRRLRGMAVTDALTGAYNRRYLELQATSCLQTWARYRQPVSMLLLDIDNFKRINDKFGHAVGDQALIKLVKLVNQRIRSVDTLCRFGGEEFVLLLSAATGEQAASVANELRQVVADTDVLPEGGMTVSIGVCDVRDADDMEHWLKLADAALYLAKKNGRNRVELATTEPLAQAHIAKTVPDWR